MPTTLYAHPSRPGLVPVADGSPLVALLLADGYEAETGPSAPVDTGLLTALEAADLFAPIGGPIGTSGTGRFRPEIATASGPPVAPVVAVAGDVTFDRTGIIWICIAGGTPGTWVDASSSGRELVTPAEITASVTTTAVGGANSVDATGLIITVPATTRPIEVEFIGNVGNLTAGNGIGYAIIEAAAGNANRTPSVQRGSYGAYTGGLSIAAGLKTREPASASARTFKLQYWCITGGTAVIVASDVGQPAILTARSV